MIQSFEPTLLHEFFKMSVYNSAKDIKPMSLEEFKVAFKWVTGRVYVENGNK